MPPGFTVTIAEATVVETGKTLESTMFASPLLVLESGFMSSRWKVNFAGRITLLARHLPALGLQGPNGAAKKMNCSSLGRFCERGFPARRNSLPARSWACARPIRKSETSRTRRTCRRRTRAGIRSRPVSGPGWNAGCRSGNTTGRPARCRPRTPCPRSRAGDARLTGEHVGPFGGFVPVEFAAAVGLQAHVHAREVLGHPGP